MLGLLIVMFGVGLFSLTFGGLTIFLTENRVKKRRENHKQKIKKIVMNFQEDKIIPTLKERNITNFVVKEGDIQANIAYNGQTLYVSLEADIYQDGDIEKIYSFEYDLEKDFLIYTDRGSYTYVKRDMYGEMNSFFTELTDKLIEVDWSKKALEPIQSVNKQEEQKITNSLEFDNLRNKAKSILKHVDLLKEEEKEKVHNIIKNDFEEMLGFYNKLNVQEKKKYEPIFLDKLKEVDKELEEITNKIEERKYKEFKEKLKKLTLEENND